MIRVLILALLLSISGSAREFPPGWLPVEQLPANTIWNDYEDNNRERLHLYLPPGDKPVRGVFICFIFHSGDPRELANLWNFALITVPFPFNYDLGHNDKRNGRYKLGHEIQDTGLLLDYLDLAAKETKHPELSTVPIVGWLGQNGSHLCADLYSRAPDRILAWSDSFPNRLRKFPELTSKIPFPFAWEISKKELRSGVRKYRDDEKYPRDLSCRANTYGFGHGIYSKYNFFMFYLDRCIRLRMPDQMPEPGQPVKLKPALREDGWEGDFDPISAWNPIASVKSGTLANSKYPVWFPDEYAAHSWRAYHSNCTDIKILTPKAAYRSTKGPESDWGLGYNGDLQSADPQTFTAQVKGNYTKLTYFDGNLPLGTATAPEWKLENIKLSPGLHVLYAVGEKPDGSKAACRPALLICK